MTRRHRLIIDAQPVLFDFFAPERTMLCSTEHAQERDPRDPLKTGERK